MPKRALLVAVLCSLLMVGLGSMATQAQSNWPPFLFQVNPTYSDGTITYELFFVSLLPPGKMTDVTIICPLPEGTQYVSGSAEPSTQVTFDGQGVKFFTPVLDNNAIPVASFTVQATNPAQKVFVTQPWLSWKGNPSGDFLAHKILTDITKPDLKWEKPLQERLLLEADATVVDGVTTFRIHPTNLAGRAFDVVVNLPLPAGVKLVSIEAPPLFTSSFDGREVSFKALELPEQIQTTLQVKVASEATAPPLLVTHAWASWRNGGKAVGHRIAPKADVRTGDMMVNPHVDGWLTADALGDVPFGNYDVTTLAAERAGPNALDVIFYTRDEIGPVGQPLFFVAYLNTACGTGKQYRVAYSHMNGRAVLQQWDSARGAWGAGTFVDGIHTGPRMIAVRMPVPLAPERVTDFCAVGRVINATRNFSQPLAIEAVPDRSDPQLLFTLRVLDEAKASTVTLYQALGLVWQDLPEFTTTRQIPGDDSQLFTRVELSELDPNAVYRYLDRVSIDALSAPSTAGSINQAAPSGAELAEGSRQASATAVTEKPPTVQPAGRAVSATVKTALSSSAPADLRGKLAVPLDNGTGVYDLHIFAVPGGQELERVADAHQPDFRYDGQRLLFDRQARGADFVYELDLSNGRETRISDAHDNEYPIYDKPGGRVAYVSTGLTLDMPEWVFEREEYSKEFERRFDPLLPRDELLDRERELDITLPRSVRIYPQRPYIYVQCSLLQPHTEAEERCRDLATQGKLYPDAIGEIRGRFPVWTASDAIVYNGCNTWAGSKVCGIFTVPAASTHAFSGGFIPARITEYADDLPSDSEGNWIAFSSRRDGNWEAYVMDLNGGQVRNLSQNPVSNDGIPTLSPDGQWAAFVSDRNGKWAIWVVPTAGGEASHLFDLPSNAPWGTGERGWITERISWGGVADK